MSRTATLALYSSVVLLLTAVVAVVLTNRRSRLTSTVVTASDWYDWA